MTSVSRQIATGRADSNSKKISSNLAVLVDPRDNVATALAGLKKGDVVEIPFGQENRAIRMSSSIPFGHKFSVSQIESGCPVIKYGETIGIAIADIHLGDHVHTHNLASNRGRGDLTRAGQ